MQLYRLTSFFDEDSGSYVVRKSKGWIFDSEGNICFNSNRFSSRYITNSFGLRTQEDGFLRVDGRQYTLVQDGNPDPDYALLAVAADVYIQVEKRFGFFRIFNEKWGNLIIIKIKVKQSFKVKFLRGDINQTLLIKLLDDGKLEVVDISESSEGVAKSKWWKSLFKFINRVASTLWKN